jgi:hypothetical protein
MQAAALCSSELSESLRPDCVVVLDRPDELVREFALGRMIDTATGHTYHPRFAPAPSEIRDRLVWRIDDTPEVFAFPCPWPYDPRPRGVPACRYTCMQVSGRWQ